MYEGQVTIDYKTAWKTGASAIQVQGEHFVVRMSTAGLPSFRPKKFECLISSKCGEQALILRRVHCVRSDFVVSSFSVRS
uniref:Uncharacterized protein n=1 Tax=Hyaloperonospora arabidopsidis (strain Emoy2) TaxID=559515 RepID=M4BUS5_HYAAE